MPKRKHHHGGGPKEITFDAEARRSYLRGFSDRKKQRRAYGLAMQKVKDRQEKLTQRKERKQSLMEQIEQSENAKQELLQSAMEEDGRLLDGNMENDNDDDDDKVVSTKETTTNNEKPQSAANKEEANTKIQKYDDKETEKRWGGQVVVTMSTAIPGDDSDNDDDDKVVKKAPRKKRGRKDEAQEYAGSVDRFMSQTVKALPGKHKPAAAHRHKGKHGASDMKGVGGAAGLQAAQKFLKRSSQDKKGKRDGKKKRKR